ncbi:hypothetical protein [Streptomyces sp. NPDC003247]|uniref:exo-rhamnogalacturonan lyase family protein n=1 Tax=Streptomyces sp. NPDC003247 TaxID=3364677 RepID=UPI0036B5A320
MSPPACPTSRPSATAPSYSSTPTAWRSGSGPSGAQPDQGRRRTPWQGQRLRWLTTGVLGPGQHPGRPALRGTGRSRRDPAPPRLRPQHNHSAGIFGVWTPVDRSTPARKVLEDRLEFVQRHHREQVDQRSWYGFWDYGDIMHSYDRDRHVWKYDVGGYAWDNSPGDGAARPGSHRAPGGRRGRLRTAAWPRLRHHGDRLRDPPSPRPAT